MFLIGVSLQFKIVVRNLKIGKTVKTKDLKGTRKGSSTAACQGHVRPSSPYQYYCALRSDKVNFEFTFRSNLLLVKIIVGSL